MNEKEILANYEFAHRGTVFFRIPDAGFLIIEGMDRLPFLQRQTSNDVNQIAPGRSVLTVLLNASARILDVFRLIQHTEDSAGLVTLPGRASGTARYLQSRVFFMDKVKITDASLDYLQIELDGLEAGNTLKQLGVPSPPGIDEIVVVDIAGVPVTILGQPGLIKAGFRLLLSARYEETISSTLTSLGALPLSTDVYKLLRVEAGLPASDFEITADHTPLETGLTGAVSDSKGCYTGQEVIARQITYDKVTHSLVGLHLASPVQGREQVWHAGRSVGSVTTAAISPVHGPIALAILKRPANLPGTDVIIGGDGKANGVPAIVAGLPFDQAALG